MPAFDVTVQGKTYHVEIPNPAVNPLEISVDGEVFQVKIEGSQVSAAASQWPAEPPRVAPEPPPLPAPPHVAIARPAGPIPVSSKTGGAGGKDMIAPMPGTILSVEAAVGETINPGDVICVLEAMKMKNPIRSTYAGIVESVPITAGQTVAYGALLARIV